MRTSHFATYYKTNGTYICLSHASGAGPLPHDRGGTPPRPPVGLWGVWLEINGFRKETQSTSSTGALREDVRNPYETLRQDPRLRPEAETLCLTPQTDRLPPAPAQGGGGEVGGALVA